MCRRGGAVHRVQAHGALSGGITRRCNRPPPRGSLVAAAEHLGRWAIGGPSKESTMAMMTCSRCDAENPVNVMNCQVCRINL
jgi:hypothetical protein